MAGTDRRARPRPAVLLSDDTLVFADASGDAIGVREGGVRWRSRFGRPESAHPSPLPLDDGGVVVATARDLAVLDAQGRQRGRTVLPEPTAAPLISALGEVVAVTASGAVWGWVPGAVEATRSASFGSPDRGRCRTRERAHPRRRGRGSDDAPRSTSRARQRRQPRSRAVGPGGLWLGPPAMRGEAATLAMLGAASELVVTVDAQGRELAVRCSGARPLVRADAGPPPRRRRLGRPLLVDAAGTVAFATLEGGVGVAVIGSGERRLGRGPEGRLPASAGPTAAGPSRARAAAASVSSRMPLGHVLACVAGNSRPLRRRREPGDRRNGWQAAGRNPIVGGR